MQCKKYQKSVRNSIISLYDQVILRYSFEYCGVFRVTLTSLYSSVIGKPEQISSLMPYWYSLLTDILYFAILICLICEILITLFIFYTFKWNVSNDHHMSLSKSNSFTIDRTTYVYRTISSTVFISIYLSVWRQI